MAWLRKRKETAALRQDKFGMLLEVEKAHQKWKAAQEALEWAVHAEEVDCAIYEMVAAERKYVMLLKLAGKVEWTEEDLFARREVQR
ncbi:DUF2508 family protein [Paenibacillus sp. J31TS4]|uniref:DUF2508 family protein n=1 Tax=Paenibacillus sp. J31TS4 TaxID=2807195 RepID=UPI0020C08F10|nr:DUF2508 family protein [Paenibacillus sp. J31TS4]